MKGLYLGLFTLAACHGLASSAVDTPDARESPQASAQPVLLAAATTPPPNGLDGSAPSSPFRGDEILAADALGKEALGYSLTALFRTSDIPAPTRAPEVNVLGLEAARKTTDLRLAIDFSPTRLRVVLEGHGFVLPTDTEIRARNDRYGHVVVWPGAASYRPLAPGSLRAALGERRFDVAPITPAEVVFREESGRRIGIKTRKADVTTRAARASFEIGRLDGAGEGGVLLCRLLLDLMNAPPGTSVCGTDELPVRAELHWTSHGSLAFELTASMKRTDISIATLVVPPQAASFAATPLPVGGVAPMLDHQELAAFRTSDVGEPSSSGDTLVLNNATLELRLLYLDGIPVAWAAPGARGELHGLHRGHYVAQWRTFLGDSLEPPVTQTVPGTVQIGVTLDAGK